MGSFKTAVEETLKERNLSKQWLANKLNKNYQTLVGKFSRDSFDDEDVFRIACHLNINLNKIRDEFFIKKGVIGIWDMNDHNKIIATRIDLDYYLSREINIHDADSAKKAIQQVVNELCKALCVAPPPLSEENIEKLCETNQFVVLKQEDREFGVAFTKENDPDKINVQFSDDCRIPHILLL